VGQGLVSVSGPLGQGRVAGLAHWASAKDSGRPRALCPATRIIVA
jgi:hypothetical protein